MLSTILYKSNLSSKTLSIKLAAFILFSLYLLYEIIFNINPTIQGDAFEYILMTESFWNHFSPDLRITDIENFKHTLELAGEYNEWNSRHIMALTNFMTSEPKFLNNDLGYFVDLNNEKYSYHFWFYSLCCIPIKIVLFLFNGNIEYIFQLSNWLFYTLTTGYILFKSKLSLVKNIFLSLFFTFSSLYWYFFWSGPEIFTMCLCMLSMVLFYEKKYYWSLLFAALSASQNPPMILLAVFVGFRALYEYKFTLKNLTMIFLAGLPGIIPHLFYYYNYKIFNLIVHAGFIKENLISFTRVWGVFFDLNEGIVLSIPILLFLAIIICIRKLLLGKKHWKYDLLIIPTVVGIALIFVNQKMWNSGIMILRYGTWTSVPIIVYSIMNINLISLRNQALMLVVLFLQVLNIYDVFGIFRMGGLQANSNQGGIHNRLAELVLRNYPEYYNPDPMIFGRRCLWGKFIDSTDSPICFYYKDENNIYHCTKAMVHKSRIDKLPKELYRKEQVETLSYLRGWAYINY